MRNWLPWIFLGVYIAIVAAAPWRRSDPHHEFVLQLVRNLPEEQDLTTGEEQQIGTGTRTGSPDRPIGTRI